MREVLVAACAAVIVLVCMPALIRYLKSRQFGQTIYELGPQAHLGKQGTPNMGGVLIASAAAITATAFTAFAGHAWQLLPAMLVSLGAMAIGFADDYIKVMRRQHEGLRPMQKIWGQVIVGLLFSIFCYVSVGSDVLIPFTKTVWNLGIFYIPLMTILVIFITNSANLQDGADGLLSSVSLVAAVAMGIIALLLERLSGFAHAPAVSVLMFSLAGACLGFLRFNFFPAKIMMGDTGSMFIGGVFVGAAMLLKMQFLLIPLCFTMIASSLSVIIQRVYYKKTGGKRIFKMSPIHHHFELSGMSEVHLVIMYTLAASALSVLAVLSVLPMLG